MDPGQGHGGSANTQLRGDLVRRVDDDELVANTAGCMELHPGGMRHDCGQQPRGERSNRAEELQSPASPGPRMECRVETMNAMLYHHAQLRLSSELLQCIPAL
jgi:hypothetical protein